MFRVVEGQVHDPGKVQSPARGGSQGGVEEVGEGGHGKALAGGLERL
jgi:hypothetical protein